MVAMRPEVAARDGIDIDEMPKGRVAAKKSDLRALGGDGDLHAERGEHRRGPGPRHEA